MPDSPNALSCARARGGTFGVMLLCSALLAGEARADVGNAVTVAGGLANPRGLAFAPNGDLYVAEAGRGGTGNCTFSPPNPNNQRCYGETGAISRVNPDGSVDRVVSGLPSLVLPDGTIEGGPVDIAFHGTSGYATLGWGGNPALRAPLGPKSHLLGTLLHVMPSGAYQMVADVAAYEAAFNPQGGNVDTNPYNAVALPGRQIVADAGANVLIEVPANGRARLFAKIPYLPPVAPNPAPREPVPTSVAEGPDGAIYVSELTSFPFWSGTSNVLRVSSDGSQVQVWLSGLTAVVDLAFDAGGALYVLEVLRGQQGSFPPPNFAFGVGRLLRKCPADATATVLLAGLTFPGGVAPGPDGAVYITNFGTSPGAGEVLRLPVTPCP